MLASAPPSRHDNQKRSHRFPKHLWGLAQGAKRKVRGFRGWNPLVWEDVGRIEQEELTCRSILGYVKGETFGFEISPSATPRIKMDRICSCKGWAFLDPRRGPLYLSAQLPPCLLRCKVFYLHFTDRTSAFDCLGALTAYRRPGGLSNRNPFSHSSVG